MKSLLLILISALLLSACAQRNENIKPVTGFEINRYLGVWYEIARMDHSFERGLSNVSAEYSLNPDGSIKVYNKGFNSDKNKWKTAVGRAKFAASQDTGEFKVSFFGPFYGAYIIVELDNANYSYALISGGSLDYLWILSRTPDLDKPTLDKLLQTATNLGYDTDKLLYPAQQTVKP